VKCVGCNFISIEGSNVMKSMQEVGAFRETTAPCAKIPGKTHGKTPGKARHAPTVAMELRVLRLAADAADIRRDFTPQQLAKCEPLTSALDACEALFEALGWGGAQQVQAHRAESSGH
jgi:hypothetical protein